MWSPSASSAKCSSSIIYRFLCSFSMYSSLKDAFLLVLRAYSVLLLAKEALFREKLLLLSLLMTLGNVAVGSFGAFTPFFYINQLVPGHWRSLPSSKYTHSGICITSSSPAPSSSPASDESPYRSQPALSLCFSHFSQGYSCSSK